MTSPTKTDLGTDAWMIDDDVVRLREWASEVHHALPDGGEVTIGAADTCSLRLLDPSGRLSRQHAQLRREAGRWIARDLDSKNGLYLDGRRRPKVLLEPGSELGMGGVTLIAESSRLIALRGFLARVLGWARPEVVDLALRSVRMASSQRAALALVGEGEHDLVAVARGIHRHTLGGERPFVLCDPRRRDSGGEVHASGMAALRAASGGTMCVWPRRLPRDYAELVAALRDPSTRIQLIACGPGEGPPIASAPIAVPAITERADEIDQLIDAYAQDAVAALGISDTPNEVDRGWVRKHSAGSLLDIEKGTLRIAALRHAGSILRAAGLLGMAHASLGEWVGRRRLPPGTLR